MQTEAIVQENEKGEEVEIARGNLITGANEAANFLGIGRRTVYRKIKSGEFPDPIAEVPMSGGKIRRVWTKSDLLEFKSNPRGRPKESLKLLKEKEKSQKIIALHSEGNSPEEISKKLKTSKDLVKKVVDIYKKEGDRSSRDKRIVEMYLKGEEQKTIATFFSISEGNVSRIVRNAKIIKFYKENGGNLQKTSEHFKLSAGRISQIIKEHSTK